MPGSIALSSFWDRLRFSREARGRKVLDLAQLEEAVCEDVRTLLNQRSEHGPSNFGLPDLIRFDGDSIVGSTALALAIQDTLRRFEPRLDNINVTVTTDARPITFRIRADLRVEPYAERVEFRATVLSDASGLQIAPFERLGPYA